MASSREYWEERAKQKVLMSERTAKKIMSKTLRIYKQTQKNIEDEIESMYAKAGSELDVDVSAYMKETVHGTTRNRLIKDIKKLAKERGIEYTLSDDFGRKLTRLDVLKKKVDIEIKKLKQDTNKLQTEGYKKIIRDTYDYTVEDLEELGKYPVTGTTLNKKTIEQVTLSNAKWDNGTYKTRNNKNISNLSGKINTLIGAGIAAGQSVEKTARQLRRDFDVSRYKATRLIQTESSYFYGQTDLETFKEYGVNSYEFLDTLDERTCEHCETLSGLVFPIDSAIPGENYPPIHPWCRCTTVAYLGIAELAEDKQKLQRVDEEKEREKERRKEESLRRQKERQQMLEEQRRKKEEKNRPLTKQEQLEIILKENPAEDEIHTWIRKLEDIKTYEEVIQEDIDFNGELEDMSPDYTVKDIKKALKNGKVVVYSSNPIVNGNFVTPSLMEASGYSGNGYVYKATVDLTDVAWIDTGQGQLATQREIEFKEIPGSREIFGRGILEKPLENVVETPRKYEKLSSKLASFNTEVLNEDEKTSLFAYTAGKNEAINKYLSGKFQKTRQLEELVKNIDSSMSKYNLPKDSIVYRGDSRLVYAEIKKGDIIKRSTYISTSISKNFSEDYAQKNYANSYMLLEIHVPKGTPCIYVEDLSILPREKELILSRNLSYKVVELSENKIVLEVVNA